MPFKLRIVLSASPWDAPGVTKKKLRPDLKFGQLDLRYYKIRCVHFSNLKTKQPPIVFAKIRTIKEHMTYTSFKCS